MFNPGSGLPREIYENRIEPKLGDSFYVVPESDSVIAEYMSVEEVYSGGSFKAGSYSFSWTTSFGHVGKSAHANAYDSLAAYHAITLIPRHGWTQHPHRKDVFRRVYMNRKIDPPIQRVAYIQVDQRDGNLVLLGCFYGQGVNRLAELSERFSVGVNDTVAPFKIRDFLIHADGIILASYAMNVTKESALGRVTEIQSYSNFERGVE